MKKRRTFKSTNPDVNLGLNDSSEITKKNFGQWILDKIRGTVFKLSDENMVAIEQDARTSEYTPRRYKLASSEEIQNNKKE